MEIEIKHIYVILRVIYIWTDVVLVSVWGLPVMLCGLITSIYQDFFVARRGGVGRKGGKKFGVEYMNTGHWSEETDVDIMTGYLAEYGQVRVFVLGGVGVADVVNKITQML